jgi:hypothetical protein
MKHVRLIRRRAGRLEERSESIERQAVVGALFIVGS